MRRVTGDMVKTVLYAEKLYDNDKVEREQLLNRKERPRKLPSDWIAGSGGSFLANEKTRDERSKSRL
jgi:hypothetical protein